MYGEKVTMDAEIQRLRNGLPTDIWLSVISQIMTRLSSKCRKSGTMSLTPFVKDIKELLLRLARSDFHSMIFPLLFESSSGNKKFYLKKYVLKLLKKEKKQYSQLIDTYRRFTQELINVSIIMEERWLEELDSIMKYYRKDKQEISIKMLDNLFNAFKDKVRHFESCSANEKTFIFKYGRQLNRAQELLELHKQFKEVSFFRQMCGIFGQVFQSFHQSLEQSYSSHMFLENVSPWLKKLRDSDILIPGLKNKKKRVYVKHINSEVIIIKSKRKPR